jgi:hypothetical protein
MVHHFLRRMPQPSPDFPARDDLPHLSPPAASAALDLLRLLIHRGDCEVYTAAGGPRANGRYFWNVWDCRTWERVELEKWAFMALCLDPDGDDGGDGGEAA